jgi:alanine racemase
VTPAAVAVIRPDALRSNLEVVRRQAPGCRVLAVVKANGYGHGLVSVARTLASADGFAVARLEEGLQLREAGIAQRIVVLGGVISGAELAAARRGGLDIVVHGTEQLDLLEREPAAQPQDVWVKVDSGMGRLGLPLSELHPALARLRACPGAGGALRVMTHLARADEPSSDVTVEQVRAFGAALGDWAGDVSIANSAGILAWPETLATTAVVRYSGVNWVRPGLMLYGVSPLEGDTASGLVPALSFETRIIAMNQLPRGRTVGYGGDWRAPRDSLIAVAAAGYGDGYPWHIARGTPVLVNGQRLPVVGRVSMDLITIDVTDAAACRVGDRVVLWGADPGVAEVARCAGRISYDLLANLSPRVVRSAGADVAVRQGA